MEQRYLRAAAEVGLGFFTMDPVERWLHWDDRTLPDLADGEAAAQAVFTHLDAPFRSYVLGGLADASRLQQRCYLPLERRVVEIVFLPCAEGTSACEGYFVPAPLHDRLDTLRRFVLASISGSLRDLMNSLIIVRDVVTAPGREGQERHRRFFSLMAEDAREVNTLLNRLGEVGNLSLSGPPHGEHMDVRQLLAAVQGDLKSLAEEAGVTLTVALPEDMPLVPTDAALFTLTCFQALHEALGHTNPLGEIVVTAADRGEWMVEIGFADNGIPPELAVNPARHDLVPVVTSDWSSSAGLQMIDSLLGLQGSRLTFLGNADGVGLLKFPLPR